MSKERKEKNHGRCGFALAVALLLLAGAFPGFVLAEEAAAVKGPVNITADKLSYDRETDTYRAEGDVVVTYDDGVLKADAVDLRRAVNEASAVGNVSLLSGRDLLEGRSVTVDLTRKTGVVTDGRMFIADNNLYLTGETIEKRGAATYHIEAGTASSCEGDRPDWRIGARQLDVTIDGYGTLKGGTFYVRDVPVLYLPYFIFPAKKTRQTGLLFPYLSRSSRDGFDIELPFYWAISPGTDATFYQRYMEERGFKEGVEFRYALSRESFGTIYGEYLDDRRSVHDDSGALGREWDSRRRWSYYLNHESSFAGGWFVRADLWKVSDIWYFRDFGAHNYYRDHYARSGEDPFRRVPVLAKSSLPFLESKARLVKDWERSNLTVLGLYTEDFTRLDNAATLQRYPEVAWTFFEQPLFGTPVHAAFGGSYDYLYREEGQRGHLAQVSPRLTAPVNLAGTLQLSPFLELHETLWRHDGSEGRPEGEDREGSREVVRTGASLFLALHRVFPCRLGTLEKIRHEIRPELTYAYVPKVQEDEAPDFATDVREENSLTYALTNVLVGRMRGAAGAVGYRELLRLKLSQTYDIRAAGRDDIGAGAGEERHFADVEIALDVTPLPEWLFRIRSSYDADRGRWEQQNYDLRVTDARGDSAVVEYRNTRDLIEEVNLHLRAVLTREIDLRYSLEKNLFEDRTVESTYGVRFHRQCWSLEIAYTDSSGDRRFMVAVFFLGLGKLGET